MSDGRVIRELRDQLAAAGLHGSFLVRDLATGEEIGIEPDAEFPIASLVKLPLAVAVLTRIDQGVIHGPARPAARPLNQGVAGSNDLPLLPRAPEWRVAAGACRPEYPVWQTSCRQVSVLRGR